MQGKLTAIAIVVLGLALACGALAWWSMQGRAMKEAGQADPVAPAVWDEKKAEQEFGAIAHVFQEAVGENKDTSSVVEPARQLVAKYPDYADAHTLLAQVLRVRGRRDESIQHLEKSLELDPSQDNVHEMVGQMHLEAGSAERAEHHFSQAVSLKPEESKYRLFLAHVQVLQQQYDAARKTLLQTLSVDSSQHKAYALMSDMYARQNKLELALAQIQKAIDNTPIIERDMQVQYVRSKSTLLRRANRPEDALLTLESLSPGERADVLVMSDMATCWAMMGEYTNAALLYEEAFQNNPVDFAMLEQAAQWRLKAGDMARAAKYLDMLRRYAPRSSAIPQLEKQIDAAGE